MTKRLETMPVDGPRTMAQAIAMLNEWPPRVGPVIDFLNRITHYDTAPLDDNSLVDEVVS